MGRRRFLFGYDYEGVKKMLHGKQREGMRMEMGEHIQRREERRAEGKLKKVIDSILKTRREFFKLI